MRSKVMMLFFMAVAFVAQAERYKLYNAQVWDPAKERDEGQLFKIDTETGDVWMWQRSTAPGFSFVLESWKKLDEEYTRSQLSNFWMIINLHNTNKTSVNTQNRP